ncbi:hypothetical protein MKEN_01145000 [Mycena kentingensis (nom. inval.)]|nr:hypothetical protein MKEN_01145000 [Mycena kentingensis (nom. inval.)]
MSTSDTSVPYHPEPGSGNYVVGTKTTYTLDLDDKMIFIDNDHIPLRPPSPDEHWVMIADVMTEPAPVPRVGGHGFVVRDKIGERFPVIFVTPTAQQDAKRFQVGSVVCIYDLAMADLMQGVGFIVKDKSKTSMIPCSIDILRQISARLFEQSRAGEFGQSCAALRLSNLKSLSRETRDVMTPLCRPNASRIDLDRMSRYLRTSSVNELAQCAPAFYAMLDPAFIPRRSDELDEMVTNMGNITIPRATELQVWERCWAWIDFFFTFYEQVLPRVGAASQQLCVDFIKFTDSVMLERLKMDASFFAERPRFFAVLFHAFSSNLATEMQMLDRMQHLVSFIRYFNPKKINRPQLEEMIYGAGGSMDALGDLLVAFVEVITPGDFTLPMGMDVMMQTAVDMIQRVNQLVPGQQGDPPLLSQSLVKHDFIPHFTRLLAGLWKNAAPLGSISQRAHTLRQALLLLKQLITRPFAYPSRIVDFLQNGLLEEFIVWTGTPDIVDGIYRELEDILLNVLVPAASYHSALMLMEEIKSAREAELADARFLTSRVFPTWQRFWEIVGQRSELRRAWNDREASLASCDNLKCGTMQPKSSFRRCGGCLTQKYCSKKCQKADWKDGQHRSTCATYQDLREDLCEIFGKKDLAFFRFIVSSQYAAARERIEEEQRALLLQSSHVPVAVFFDSKSSFQLVPLVEEEIVRLLPHDPTLEDKISRARVRKETLWQSGLGTGALRLLYRNSDWQSKLTFIVAMLTLHLILAAVYSGAAFAKILESVSDLPRGLDYDFVVVGGGTAGNVIANRLTENPKFSVLVIEAGPTNRGILNSMIPWSSFFGAFLANPMYHWNYTTVPQPGINGRVLGYSRARVLGGCSSHNAMVYTRGSSDDFDRYARAAGDPGWSWHAMLPYILKANSDKHDTRGEFEPSVHSTHGINSVSLPGFQYETFSKHILQTTKELPEFRYNIDYNSGKPLGLGWLQSTIGDGMRSSSATSYLADHFLERKNLDVLLNAQVSKLVLSRDATRGKPSFSGVEFRQGSSLFTATARKEIILSAGAIGTPNILFHSGIGDRNVLAPLGIETVHDLPSVGKNVSDQGVLSLVYAVNLTDTYDVLRANMTLFNERFAQWNESHTGPLVMLGLTHLSWHRVDPNLPIFKTQEDPSAGPNTPHIEIMYYPGGSPVLTTGGNFVQAGIAALTPASRGSISINSSDPFDPPVIDIGLFTDPQGFDVLTLREGIKLTRRFFAAPNWQNVIIGPVGDPPLNATDEELDAFVRSRAGASLHAVGTASMSPRGANYGVVDPDLLVKGVKGVSIVDASVIPFVNSGHTQAPVYAFAERAADLIKQRWM